MIGAVTAVIQRACQQGTAKAQKAQGYCLRNACFALFFGFQEEHSCDEKTKDSAKQERAFRATRARSPCSRRRDEPPTCKACRKKQPQKEEPAQRACSSLGLVFFSRLNGGLANARFGGVNFLIHSFAEVPLIDQPFPFLPFFGDQIGFQIF